MPRPMISRTTGFRFVAFISFITVSCASHAGGSAAAPLQKYESVKPKMGTGFRIVLYAEDEKTARAAIEAVWARIDQLNAILSDYDPNSELSRVCQMTSGGPMSQPVHISDDFYRVLARSLEMSKASEGTFDVTIGPCVRLWRRSRHASVADAGALAAARASVGYQFVKLDPANHTVQLLKAHAS